MKSYVLFLMIVTFNCCAMTVCQSEEQEAKDAYYKKSGLLSEYQKTRDRMLIEQLGVYGFVHLNDLNEQQKNEQFNEKFDMRWYIAYESKRCLNWSAASVLAWLGTALCANVVNLEYTDARLNQQFTSELQRTVTIAACSVCGAAMCCAACVSTAVLNCDVCKGLRYGKSQQKKYEQVLQLKMGAKKNE